MSKTSRPTSSTAQTPRNIEEMPRDVGWLLLAAGLIGEIAPGVIGTPFWLMGSLILWPGAGKRVESWLESRAPGLLRGGRRQVGRFLSDLERRYPPSLRQGQAKEETGLLGADSECPPTAGASPRPPLT